ncbi:peroxiredoxin-like family protein [Nocardia goodfellowii]
MTTPHPPIRTMHPAQRRLQPGDSVAARTLTTIHGREIAVPDPESLVHLQFRRHAGCPVCDLHLRSVVARHAEITAAGVHEVVLFHASPNEVRRYESQLPLDVVADPHRRLYAEFGVQRSWRAFAAPRVIIESATKAVLGSLRGERRFVRLRPEGGRRGLPADFLLAPDATIRAAKYGQHAGDQWSVDELLELATTTTTAQPPHQWSASSDKDTRRGRVGQ